MPQPSLTVLIPTYNGARWLPEALESIARQVGDGPRVIVVDDGSTDNTVAQARRFESRLDLVVFEREHTGNWVTQTNWGLRQATSEFVAILHQDDRWRTDRLRAFRELMRTEPQAALFIHPVGTIDSSGRGVGAIHPPFPRQAGIVDSQLAGERILVQNSITCCGAVFRRDAAVAVGGLDESLWYAADWDFWLKLIAHGAVCYLPSRLADLRVHPQSQTVARLGECDDIAEQLSVVWNRHVALWCAPSAGGGSRRLARISWLSLELNGLLARRGTARPWRRDLCRLLARFVGLGPVGAFEFVRDSRILSRAWCRWRALG